MSWENGYFICPNRLLKDFEIKDYNFRVLLFIHSWAFATDKRFSVRFISDEINIGRKQAHEALKRLCKLGYLTKVSDNDPKKNNGTLYKSNLELIIELNKKETIREEVENSGKQVGGVLPESTGCTPREYGGVLPESTILINKELTLEVNIHRGLTNPDTQVLELFDFWNNQKIRTYRPTKIQYSRIIKVLKTADNKPYQVQDHIDAISRYAEVLHSENHFIDYKWDLYEFLKRDTAKRYYNTDFKTDDFLKSVNDNNSSTGFEETAKAFLNGE